MIRLLETGGKLGMEQMKDNITMYAVSIQKLD
jgi:hypothetical protein